MQEKDKQELWAWSHGKFGIRLRNTGDPEMDRDEHSSECPGCKCYHYIVAYKKDFE